MEPLFRVLLVDDEEELVFTLAERLKIRKIDPVAVTSGEVALAEVAGQPFDVVLLDVKMPGMGGFEVMKRIKAQRPRLPVILITGHGSAEDGERGMAEGAFDYVMKPINIEELVQKLGEAVRREISHPEEGRR